MRTISSNEQDTAKLNCIEKKEWLKRYKTLWYMPSEEYQSENGLKQINDSVDIMNLDEFQVALTKFKN